MKTMQRSNVSSFRPADRAQLSIVNENRFVVNDFKESGDSKTVCSFSRRKALSSTLLKGVTDVESQSMAKMKTRPPSKAAKAAPAPEDFNPPKRPETAPGRTRRLTIKRHALGPIGKLEDFIPYKLAVVANRVSQSIGNLFETKFNIHFTEWRILMALYAYSELSFAEVVERTSMDKARVSRAQKRLVDLGMVRTRVDPDDGRRLFLSLTPTGAQRCNDILPSAAAREAWFLAALDDVEHRQLDIILNKLIARSNELVGHSED